MMLPRKKNKNKCFGIGVDLLAYERLQGANRNPRQWARLLTAREYQQWKRTRYSVKRLALLLTAKEAAFKASGSVWMGPHQFNQYEVTIMRRGSFQVTSSNPASIFKGSYFQLHGYAGAQVINWE